MVSSESLDGITAGTDVEIVRVTGRAQVSSFLAASGMESGTLVTVIASGSGGILVSGPGGEVHLDAGTAATVVVQARGRHGG
jgi:Fe2+ transport system protein FeoA